MKTRAAASPLSATALQFSTEGTFFVTGGSKHLKHWTIGGPRDRLSGVNINSGMDGKPIKLGSQKDSSFICIASTPIRKEQSTGVPVHQPIYALTSVGNYFPLFVACLSKNIRVLAVEKNLRLALILENLFWNRGGSRGTWGSQLNLLLLCFKAVFLLCDLFCHVFFWTPFMHLQAFCAFSIMVWPSKNGLT